MQSEQYYCSVQSSLKACIRHSVSREQPDAIVSQSSHQIISNAFEDGSNGASTDKIKQDSLTHLLTSLSIWLLILFHAFTDRNNGYADPIHTEISTLFLSSGTFSSTIWLFTGHTKIISLMITAIYSIRGIHAFIAGIYLGLTLVPI